MFNNIPRLQVLVAPVPDPHENPLGRAYEPGITNILLHPYVPTAHALKAMCRFLTLTEWEQWLDAFSVENTRADINRIKKYPNLYLPRWVTKLEVTPENIPRAIRHPHALNIMRKYRK